MASRHIALDYEKPIIAQCRQLQVFPHRGNRHDEIMPGLRMMVSERRVTIAFIVHENRVVIEAVFYGGQNITAAFTSRS